MSSNFSWEASLIYKPFWISRNIWSMVVFFFFFLIWGMLRQLETSLCSQCPFLCTELAGSGALNGSGGACCLQASFMLFPTFWKVEGPGSHWFTPLGKTVAQTPDYGWASPWSWLLLHFTCWGESLGAAAASCPLSVLTPQRLLQTSTLISKQKKSASGWRNSVKANIIF